MMLDFHTHHLQRSDALISAKAHCFAPEEGRCYSVGIHPWDTAGDVDFTLLEAAARHPQVLAIGETGLDSLRGASLEVQETIFRRHIALAEEVGKPLVIHCVRTSQQVLKAWRESRRLVPWAIHGFRGGERVVAPLVQAGFYVSFGEQFNAQALQAVPLGQMLAETDESLLPIDEIVARMAQVLHVPVHQMERTLEANLHRLLNF
ncbi:MAG: TatD family hydrolase [Bacteroidales bacterium]|nr:TatD family hydrolase [Bacteroidales bacterium]